MNNAQLKIYHKGNRMKRFYLIFAGALVLFGLSHRPVQAADALEGFKLGGNIFFDYSHGITNGGPRVNGQANGFEFRRAYLTVDKDVNETFAIRFRTDAERSPHNKKMRPFVKHLYLQWKNPLPESKLYIGMIGTPTWEIAEGLWGYRGLAPTSWDQFKIATGASNSANSADVGMALKGTLAKKKLSYNVMLGNGSHYSSPETDMYKKLYASVAATPGKLTIEGYVDYEAKGPDANNMTFKGFVGYKADKFVVGGEFYNMTLQGRGTVKDDLNMTTLSVFGRYDVNPKGTAILRLDMYEPDADVDDNETSLLIVGYDYKPHKNIHFVPNLWYYMNAEGVDAEKDPDAVGNLTFIWDF